MQGSHFQFWWRWLVGATLGVIVMGLGMLALSGVTGRVFGLLFFSSPDYFATLGSSTEGYIQFAHAVTGAVLVGWGTALLLILMGPFRRGSRDAWRTLSVSLLAWFIPDTAVSLLWGFWPNAVLNSGLALLFTIPLAFTYQWTRE